MTHKKSVIAFDLAGLTAAYRERGREAAGAKGRTAR